MQNKTINCQLLNTDILPIISYVEPIDIDKIIGKNLKRLRTERNITQDELSKKIATPWTRLSAYENGREGMGKDIMMRICKALNIEPWEFYITDSTPIILNETEREALNMTREAGALHVAEDIARYGRFRIEEAKKKSGDQAAHAAPRPQRIRKKTG